MLFLIKSIKFKAFYMQMFVLTETLISNSSDINLVSKKIASFDFSLPITPTGSLNCM